eukprot:360919-Chlamydomonas_euryale.AAC.6
MTAGKKAADCNCEGGGNDDGWADGGCKLSGWEHDGALVLGAWTQTVSNPPWPYPWCMDAERIKITVAISMVHVNAIICFRMQACAVQGCGGDSRPGQQAMEGAWDMRVGGAC